MCYAFSSKVLVVVRGSDSLQVGSIGAKLEKPATCLPALSSQSAKKTFILDWFMDIWLAPNAADAG